MALGILLDDGVTYVTPDKRMNKARQHRVLLASFGDGYEQRALDGINFNQDSFTVAFINRPKAEIDDISAFLSGKKGVTSFTFTYPDDNAMTKETSIKVVCPDHMQEYSYDNYYSLSATLRRVYE